MKETNANQTQLKRLNQREIQLWVLGGVVSTVMMLAIATSIAPDALSYKRSSATLALDMPQLTMAFACLLVLFGVYVNHQRRELGRARDALYRRLLMEEAKAEGLIDRETQTYSPVVIESMLDKLSKDATEASPLVILEIGVAHMKSIERRNGSEAVEHLNRALSEILRSSLRGSDRICRSGQGNFIVFLPDTQPYLSGIPVKRILSGVDRWNQSTASLNYRLTVAISTVCTFGQVEPAQLLEQSHRQRREAEGATGSFPTEWFTARSEQKETVPPAYVIAAQSKPEPAVHV